MSIAVRSFAKINLGLKIGPARPDGFHELRTVYQTLALHDVVRVRVEPGDGIEIRCDDPRVPLDESNTCWKVARRMLARLSEPPVPPGLEPAWDDEKKETRNGASKVAPLHRAETALGQSRIVIEIEKRLPVQGGMGAASSNGVATLLAMERALYVTLNPQDKLRIAAEVGSDLPLFLIGGTVLGVGRGEEVYPLPDLPPVDMVVVTPPVGVSTPKAFAQWDALVAERRSGPSSEAGEAALTASGAAGTINQFSASVFSWLSIGFPRAGQPASGVPVVGGDRAETPLLDLVRAGIENDFECVVFSEYPVLREVKRGLEREGALYASLSGSGSTLYGLFASSAEAQAAAARLQAAGHAALATRTMTRKEYWSAVSSL